MNSTASALPVNQEHASKRYGSTTVVNDFSFHANPGETVARLGPNGAGKTTSISMMLGLKHMSVGAAHIFGREPVGTEARVCTGIMLQESGLPATLKVRKSSISSPASIPIPSATPMPSRTRC